MSLNWHMPARSNDTLGWLVMKQRGGAARPDHRRHKLHLIHVHPNAGALNVRGRTNVAFLDDRRRGCYGDRRAKHRSSSD